jgi:hypothetical protein
MLFTSSLSLNLIGEPKLSYLYNLVVSTSTFDSKYRSSFGNRGGFYEEFSYWDNLFSSSEIFCSNKLS